MCAGNQLVLVFFNEIKEGLQGHTNSLNKSSVERIEQIGCQRTKTFANIFFFIFREFFPKISHFLAKMNLAKGSENDAFFRICFTNGMRKNSNFLQMISLFRWKPPINDALYKEDLTFFTISNMHVVLINEQKEYLWV